MPLSDPRLDNQAINTSPPNLQPRSIDRSTYSLSQPINKIPVRRGLSGSLTPGAESEARSSDPHLIYLIAFLKNLQLRYCQTRRRHLVPMEKLPIS